MADRSATGLLLAPIVLVHAACSGGGAAATEAGAAPTATVRFPFDGAVTTAGTVTVAGSSYDPSGVYGVSVAGVPATSSDGFAHWSASVPLADGPHVLPVSTTDMAGNSDGSAALVSVLRAVRTTGPWTLSFDAVGSRLFVGDHRSGGLFAVDPATGVSTPITGFGRGTGPDLESTWGVTTGPFGLTAYAIEGASPSR